MNVQDIRSRRWGTQDFYNHLRATTITEASKEPLKIGDLEDIKKVGALPSGKIVSYKVGVCYQCVIHLLSFYNRKRTLSEQEKEYILINAFTLDSKTNPEYFFSTNRALSAMECLGYNYNKPKKSNYMKKAKETAANLPSYPSEGYIEESGEFVAVNLGNY